jgi:predicted  nucleic acid-binding Zn-ribbon protein
MFHVTGLTGWQRAAMGEAAPAGSDAAIPTKQQEFEALKQQATALAEMLDGIRQRIDKIESYCEAE